jgi:GT2 family glycosyltransferase
VTPGLVSAVLVTWNSARLLPGCLDALAAQEHRPLEVVAVDNGSTDGSLDLLAARGVRTLRNEGNVGFAAANNQGIGATDGEFVLLLNTDVVLAPDYVARLVAALEADERRGSATGKLLRGERGPAGEPVLDSTGHVMYRCDWAVNRGQGEVDDGIAYSRPEEVFGVCAAAALYRRTMLDDVAPDGEVLDARFFAYVEDVDLDWRARLRGWRAWYEPAATALHLRSASGARRSAGIQRRILANRLLMILKNEGGTGFWRRLPGILAFTAAKVGQLLLTRPGALAGLWDAVRLTPSALRSRREIRARRAAAPDAVAAWFRPLRAATAPPQESQPPER